MLDSRIQYLISRFRSVPFREAKNSILFHICAGDYENGVSQKLKEIKFITYFVV